MALSAGHVRSGGRIIDVEGRRVVRLMSGSLPVGAYRSGGRVLDEDGYELVEVEGVSGGELDYAEYVATAFAVPATLAAAVDVPGLTIAFTMPDRPVMVEAFAHLVSVVAAGAMNLGITKSDNTLIGQATATATAAGQSMAGLRAVRRLTTADFPLGSEVTLKARMWTSAPANGGSLFTVSGVVPIPASLRALLL